MQPIYTEIPHQAAQPIFLAYLQFFGAVGFMIGLMLFFCLSLHNSGKQG